jgi:hypothetical protein
MGPNDRERMQKMDSDRLVVCTAGVGQLSVAGSGAVA